MNRGKAIIGVLMSIATENGHHAAYGNWQTSCQGLRHMQ